MLQFVFFKIMYMSIAGGAVTGLIFLLQLVSKKYFSYQWHYYIWVIALAPFIIPFSGSLLSDMPNYIPVPIVTASSSSAELVNSNSALTDSNANEEMHPSPILQANKIPINDVTKTFIPLFWIAVLLLLPYTRPGCKLGFPRPFKP